MTRVFSGIQPTGGLHLGNYLGALRRWVELQSTMECIYCLVDLHAITVNQDPKQLKTETLNAAAMLLACGINPEKHILFQQSHNDDHSSLAWIFQCVGRMGWLNRMTQFKDKAGKNRERASVGLFTYPCLMAADILAYKATHVPVGEDQKQHLELTRDIAQKFNHDYGIDDFFPIVEPVIDGPAPRVMSLRDGNSKMSKSDDSKMSCVFLHDDNDTINQKIRKAKTDSLAIPDSVDDLKERPEAQNLIGILAALKQKSAQEVCSEYAGQNFSTFKSDLSEQLIDTIAPIRDSFHHYQQDLSQVSEILNNGAQQAKAISSPILAEIKQVIGIGPR